MEIYEKAPAKINLGLDVLYKRADDYHELRMVMASVDLADHLKIESLPTDEIIVTSNKAILRVDTLILGLTKTTQHCGIEAMGSTISPLPLIFAVVPCKQNGTSVPTCMPISINAFR